MLSPTEICNMALSHLGHGKDISDVETDTGAEAKACRIFYPTVRNKTLAAHDWQFARQQEALAFIDEDTEREWRYKYYAPSDCLALRKILSGVRNETRDSIIPFEMGYDSSRRVVYTDKVDAVAKYTMLITDSSLFTVEFELALSHHLAYYLAPRICKADPFKVGLANYQAYQKTLGEAKDSSSNEGIPDREPDAEYLRARNGVE